MGFKKALRELSPFDVLLLVGGSAILAFGLYQVHSVSGVTEGGVLGLNLLLNHHFGISPSVTNFLFGIIFYTIGWRILGTRFILRSAIAAASFSLSYAIIEQFPRLFEELYTMPLLASLLGALFVGVGTGICIRAGGAICGDDAMAMALSKWLGVKIQWVYLVSDLTVLGLSLTYIPLGRIIYSLLTVFISGQIIGFIERIGLPRHGAKK